MATHSDFASALGRQYADLLAYGTLPTKGHAESIGGRQYITFGSEGVSFVLDELGMVCAVQFYGRESREVARFKDPLPQGISFDMTKVEARAALGSPSASKDAANLTFIGNVPSWDKWVKPGLVLHAEYDFDEGSIRLVSLLL
jgi:hypothetical protein